MGNTLNRRRRTAYATTSPYGSSTLHKNSAASSIQRDRKNAANTYEKRAKTLPVRSSKIKRKNQRKATIRTLPKGQRDRSSSDFGHTSDDIPPTPPPPNGETSRVLFLLYLIHKTWNVIKDGKSKGSHGKMSPKDSNQDSLYETESICSLSLSELYAAGAGNHNNTEADDCSQYCSQYSVCSCSSCYNRCGRKSGEGDEQNLYNSIDEKFSQDSIALDEAASICKRLVKLFNFNENNYLFNEKIL